MKIPEYEEMWTGDYIFENEWQDFRTKKKRELVLQTPPWKLERVSEKWPLKLWIFLAMTP